jgi:Skp family chaperone for outer membrane proteins
LQQQLVRAQQRKKQHADKHKSEQSLEVGDMVYLKLQSSMQSSLVKRANHKLPFKFFGHYPLVAKVGSVAYKL